MGLDGWVEKWGVMLISIPVEVKVRVKIDKKYKIHFDMDPRYTVQFYLVLKRGTQHH